MYLNYYNLKAKPFQISTDPRFLWLGEKHQEAMAVLRYGIMDNKGFLLLTGEVGTGKTTLIHALINALGDDVIIANVPDPGLETMEFYAYIARAYHLGNGFKSKYEFLATFGKFLNRAHAENKKVLLVIDEAQRMDQSLLEEIRLLSNIEKQSAKLINIFFVGQSEFNGIILENRNSALRQRITINYDLGPLSLKETDSYIRHRLKVGGTQTRIFKTGAIKEIHSFSEGYPRLVNVICDRALVTGYTNEAASISGAVIRECADEMRMQKRDGRKKEPARVPEAIAVRRRTSPYLYVLLGVLVLIWIGIAGYVYSPETFEKITGRFLQPAAPPPETVTRQPMAVSAPAPVNPPESIEPKIEETPIVPPLATEPESVPPEEIQVMFDRDIPQHVAFDDDNNLSAEGFKTLDKLAKVLLNDPALEITIKGYSKGFGSYRYNKKMSEFSANIVKGYLVGKGVQPSRIETMGVLLGAEEGANASGGEEEIRWVEILAKE